MAIGYTYEEARKIFDTLKKVEYDGKKVLKPYIANLEFWLTRDLSEVTLKAPLLLVDDLFALAHGGSTKNNFIYSLLFDPWSSAITISAAVEALTNGKYSANGIEHDANELKFKRIKSSKLEENIK